MYYEENTLNGLSDTNFSSLSDGDLLQYNSTDGNWENFTPSYVTETEARRIAKKQAIIFG